LSYRHVEALLEERGLPVDHATIQRWVVQDRPRLEAACQRRTRYVWVSWRMAETDMQVQGQGRYLSRAVEKQGQTIAFLLTQERAEPAAPRFRTKVSRRHGVPEKLTSDGSAANAAAMQSYNATHGPTITIRKSKYLNNIVAPDHRGVKRLTRPMLGCKSCHAAQGTFTGVALMHMLRTGQLADGVEQDLTTAAQFYALAA